MEESKDRGLGRGARGAALKSGSIKLEKALLALGMGSVARAVGRGELFYAMSAPGKCDGDKARCVEALIEFGADPSMEDASGLSPLHFAAHMDLPLCVRALARAGADVERRTAMEGYAPLHSAADAGAAGALWALAELGADLQAKDGQGRTPLDVGKSSKHWSAPAACAELAALAERRQVAQDAGALAGAGPVARLRL